jgi:hypothetical protein
MSAVAEIHLLEGWRLTAVALLAAGLMALVQASLAALSVHLGPESDVYQQYIRWAPAANLSRGGLIIGYAALLLATFVSGGSDRLRRLTAPVLILAASLGLVLGGIEGPIVAARHFPRMILFDLVELVLLGTVLLVGIVRSTDRVLWTFVSL